MLRGGVRLLVGEDVFDYTRQYLGDFGVIYPSVPRRVTLLVVGCVTLSPPSISRSTIGHSRRPRPQSWPVLGPANIIAKVLRACPLRAHKMPTVTDNYRELR